MEQNVAWQSVRNEVGDDDETVPGVMIDIVPILSFLWIPPANHTRD